MPKGVYNRDEEWKMRIYAKKYTPERSQLPQPKP